MSTFLDLVRALDLSAEQPAYILVLGIRKHAGDMEDCREVAKFATQELADKAAEVLMKAYMVDDRKVAEGMATYRRNEGGLCMGLVSIYRRTMPVYGAVAAAIPVAA